MGRLVNGLNGPFTGKAGSVIGSSRNGIPYIKGPYKSRTKNISEKEELSRRKFADAQAWLKPTVAFVRIGFKGYSVKSEGFIAAKSYLMKNALTVEDGEIVIDPALVKLSHGNLPMSPDASFRLTAPDKLTITWNPETPVNGDDKDQIMILAYNCKDYKLKPGDVSILITGQFRGAGEDILSIDVQKPGTVLHIYIAFVAADRSRQSDSLYLGELTI
ncbi:DUF6266 family protein [Daejeonella sp. JGW-45]|uniref:DUF6266 family protein n=1 Tax=Daejeonella sp. JGW-45 TaxID=3034148 RepID=UPI0023EC9CB9|nr:DUF6266 family protein [Daejeonella sp. JGW-45]